MHVSLDQIRIDGDTQVRVAIDQATVDEYAELFQAGKTLPKLTVFHDGAAHWLADGFHRYHAARKAGLVAIGCDVHRGTVAEARWAACGANAAHGLRRTNADKRRAVEMALKMKPELSDEAISDHAGVSRVFVHGMRPQVVNGLQPDHRIGKDGKRYPAPPPPKSKGLQPPPPKRVSPIPPDRKAVTTDAMGRAIPDTHVLLWHRRAEIDELKQRVSELRVAIRKAREASDPLFRGLPQDVGTWLDNTYRELDNCRPYLVCPWCGGMSKSCRMCGGPERGFVSEFQYKTFATDEMKAVVERARG